LSIGSGFVDQIRTVCHIRFVEWVIERIKRTNWIQICQPDLDSSTGSGFTNRIWIHQPDSNLATGMGSANRIRICKPDPDLPTGSVFAEQIKICQPDPDSPTGSGFANRIRICQPNPDFPTGFSNRILGYFVGLLDNIRIYRTVKIYRSNQKNLIQNVLTSCVQCAYLLNFLAMARFLFPLLSHKIIITSVPDPDSPDMWVCWHAGSESVNLSTESDLDPDW
jgi:hypothetical protein